MPFARIANRLSSPCFFFVSVTVLSREESASNEMTDDQIRRRVAVTSAKPGRMRDPRGGNIRRPRISLRIPSRFSSFPVSSNSPISYVDLFVFHLVHHYLSKRSLSAVANEVRSRRFLSHLFGYVRSGVCPQLKLRLSLRSTLLTVVWLCSNGTFNIAFEVRYVMRLFSFNN